MAQQSKEDAKIERILVRMNSGLKERFEKLKHTLALRHNKKKVTNDSYFIEKIEADLKKFGL